MRLRPNEFCPIHKSTSCCGHQVMPRSRLIRLGVQRIEDPHHQRGYTDYNDVVPDHRCGFKHIFAAFTP